MTDLVGGVEPERQEWDGRLALVHYWPFGDVVLPEIRLCIANGPDRWLAVDGGDILARQVEGVVPMVAVPAGFGERLAQAIEGLRVPGNLPMAQAWDMRERAAALVREQFTQLAGHDRNKT